MYRAQIVFFCLYSLIFTMDAFVYYRVPMHHVAAAQACVQALQQLLRPTCRVPMRLMRRADAADDEQTWMEIHREVPADFAATLQAATVASGLLEWITGARRCEYFVDIAPCA